MERNKLHHRGRLSQIPIYLGKFFRMFLYMDDWKVLPMAALIAAVVAFTVGKNMFLSMEGTLKGGLAFSCVCLWNGCFNSIQVVCRERGIVKREHRSGMHVSSYIAAHMIYQGFLCLLQTAVTIAVCKLTTVKFPKEGFLTPWFLLEIGITFFLITYAADMLSLTISCIARNTTAAMTIMPFLLIFQLVFSNGMFGISGRAMVFTNLSLAKWGIDCICAQGDYNNLPMVSAWQQIKKLEDLQVGELDPVTEKEVEAALILSGMSQYVNKDSIEEGKPIKALVKAVEKRGLKDDFCMKAAEANRIASYERTPNNIKNCWSALIGFILVFAFLAMALLKRIDKDKR